MPHSSRVNFDELKAQADFRAVLSHYGLSPVGEGEQVKILCPFHADERPSCSVNLTKKLFHCFGCGLTGNVLDFVHRMETKDGQTVSLRQAGLTLAEICGVPVPSTTAHSGARTRADGLLSRKQGQGPSTPPAAAHGRSEREQSASSKRDGPKPEVLRNKPLGFKLSLDPSHPYLSKRGLSPMTIELFGLGFFAGEKGSMMGRVCIPIHNVDGEIVAYAGRWVGSDEELPRGEEKYKLPVGFHKRLELFNLYCVKHCKHLIVVEGFFDAIRLFSLHLPAVALMGTSLSEEQVALLRAHCPALRCITVLLDGDEAGRAAAPAVAARLALHWWTRIAELPIGTQPDTVESSALMGVLGKAPVQG